MSSAAPPSAGRAKQAWLLAAGAAMALVLARWLYDFPAARLPLAMLFLAAGAAVVWRPVLLLVLVPAALPVLDLAPWTGRRFVDEFDMLLLCLVLLAWARLSSSRLTSRPMPEAWALAAVLLVLAGSAASVLPTWPWPMADLADPGNPLSPLNGLRLLKGALQATALWAMARRMARKGMQPGAAFCLGMVLGLVATVATIFVERMAFSYLLDFSSPYRIAGPFSAMSLGGAYVECYLAVATPFLLAALMARPSAPRLLGGAALLAGTSYALMVTYSRGGYAAMALGVGMMLAGALLARQRQRQRQGLAVALVMAGLAGMTAYPVLTGAFAQARLNTIASDLSIREQHWADSLRLLGTEPLRHALGVGLGRFADAYFWAGPQGEQAGGHRLIDDPAQGQALRLGAGYAYFVDQIVSLQADAHYRLSYRMRPDGPAGALQVELCQKWLIASAECTRGKPKVDEAAALPPVAGAWQTVMQDIQAPAAGPGRLPRPLRLSLHNEGAVSVAVDQVSLLSGEGQEMVNNGGFSQGMDHWTVTSDQHLSWHAKSMLLSLYVELGLLGVAVMLALMMMGVWRASRATLQGRPEAMAMLAALAVFGVIGMIDSLVDAPRFLLLWLLLCLMPCTLVEPTAPARLR